MLLDLFQCYSVLSKNCKDVIVIDLSADSENENDEVVVRLHFDESKYYPYTLTFANNFNYWCGWKIPTADTKVMLCCENAYKNFVWW